MKRTQLEHIIRAAATIAEDDEIIVIGSQAVLGQFPEAPAELCVSNEADVYPKNKPERWELIDGTIGELSPFHDTFGRRFVRACIRHLPVDEQVLRERLAKTGLPDEQQRAHIEALISADFAGWLVAATRAWLRA